ncbi:MAG: hypothetical protein IIC71_12435 [Acidobacteria bacterium]|nr:hypothetical protein [Acidobacteriota bacterium]
MPYTFSFTFFVTNATGRRASEKRLEILSDELITAMLKCETDIVFDSSVGGVLSTGEIDVDIAVNAETGFAAGAIAKDFVIESIKATGGIPAGILVFPPSPTRRSDRQKWHERRVELSEA